MKEGSQQQVIETMILVIRGQKVILDRDLAGLYRVSTKAINQSVKRNIQRFPEDFMFQLSAREFKNWKSQFVTSNSDRMKILVPFGNLALQVSLFLRLKVSPDNIN
ncbi:ORF6N domain-containing protein [Candidatus Omnitrophota bacterium]